MCIRMQNDHIYMMLKILQPMSEFGGLWKHRNNPACTKSVKSLQNVGCSAKEEDLPACLSWHKSTIHRETLRLCHTCEVDRTIQEVTAIEGGGGGGGLL